jgi:hypothetical protein
MITGLGMFGPFSAPFHTLPGSSLSKWTMTTSGSPATWTVFPFDEPLGILSNSTPVASPVSASKTVRLPFVAAAAVLLFMMTVNQTSASDFLNRLEDGMSIEVASLVNSFSIMMNPQIGKGRKSACKRVSGLSHHRRG